MGSGRTWAKRNALIPTSKSYYNGKKISKIVLQHTVDPSQFKIPVEKFGWGIFSDPTLGVFASALHW